MCCCLPSSSQELNSSWPPIFLFYIFFKYQKLFPPTILSYAGCDSVDQASSRSSHKAIFPSGFLEAISSPWFVLKKRSLFSASTRNHNCTSSQLPGNLTGKLRWITFGGTFLVPSAPQTIKRGKSEIPFQEFLDMRDLARLLVTWASEASTRELQIWHLY